ncbi:hypothetical protein CVT26_009967 [Gymnopilus dilepis]|uniref:Uncharacterized protein n=1 Tax=Gymnopilus dilepis TaxID=231916 RepID=A0A409VL90_9AGAR|nr:hypothetical protein CVT26_009967 [Gymnopilus dilepis]
MVEVVLIFKRVSSEAGFVDVGLSCTPILSAGATSIPETTAYTLGRRCRRTLLYRGLGRNAVNEDVEDMEDERARVGRGPVVPGPQDYVFPRLRWLQLARGEETKAEGEAVVVADGDFRAVVELVSIRRSTPMAAYLSLCPCSPADIRYTRTTWMASRSQEASPGCADDDEESQS